MVIDAYIQCLLMNVGFFITMFTMLRVKERFRWFFVPFLLTYSIPDFWIINPLITPAVENGQSWFLVKTILALGTLLCFVVLFEGGVWKIAITTVVCDILSGMPQTAFVRFSEENPTKLEFVPAPALPYIPFGAASGFLLFLCAYFLLRRAMLKFAESEIDKNFWARILGSAYWINISAQILAPWFTPWRTEKDKRLLFGGAVVFLLAVLMVLYWTWRQMLFRERYYLRRQAEIMQEYYDALQEQVETMEQWEQEIYSVAKTCFGKKKTGSGARTPDRTFSGQTFSEQTIPAYTESVVVNQVLAGKKDRCERERILFDVRAREMELGCVKEKDLVILLFNILDNAIEECEKLEEAKERRVSLQMEQRADGLWLYCENSARMQKSSGVRMTTRKKGSYHGSGVKIVRELVEKYGGQMRIERSEKNFFVEISGLKNERTDKS